MVNPEFKETVENCFQDWWEMMATSVIEDGGAVFCQLFFTIMPLTFGILSITLGDFTISDIVSGTISGADRWILGLGIVLTAMGSINLIMHIIGVVLWIFGIRR